MKLLFPLVALSLFLTACSSPNAPRRALWATSEAGGVRAESGSGHNTLWGPETPTRYFADPNATRHNLYSPDQPSGPYTREMRDGSWSHKVKPADEEMRERREEEKVRQMQKTVPAR